MWRADNRNLPISNSKPDIRYINALLYAYVAVAYVYECHMSNLTRVQTIWNLHISSRKHAYIILTPLNPTFI